MPPPPEPAPEPAVTAAPAAAFALIGAAAPASPVVLSVPHAGRVYPPTLLAALRVPGAALTRLEDRHVDAVALAARGAEAMLIQRLGRAWIDLNRGEDERDPAVDEGVMAPPPAQRSAKLRSGLGLVPHRAGAAGPLWKRRFTAAEIDERIVRDHRGYHRALADLLAKARQRFGIAVLIDLHSMPPLAPGEARIVLGDRFGRSAASRFVARAEGAFAQDGWRVARNAPYAGGHILARHGRPAAGVHALQVEIDRSLYLDASLDRPGGGLSAVAAAVARLCAALADEAATASCKGRLAAE